MVLTFLLGLAFLYLQYVGWEQLVAMGVPLKTNPSGDFVYAISGIHAAHVLGGITILIVALIVAFRLPFKVTPARKLRLELSLTYWHFVDVLWIYLILFLSLQR
jgi:cytochrome c oxidase subunit 3